MTPEQELEKIREKLDKLLAKQTEEYLADPDKFIKTEYMQLRYGGLHRKRKLQRKKLQRKI